MKNHDIFAQNIDYVQFYSTNMKMNVNSGKPLFNFIKVGFKGTDY